MRKKCVDVMCVCLYVWFACCSLFGNIKERKKEKEKKNDRSSKKVLVLNVRGKRKGRRKKRVC